MNCVFTLLNFFPFRVLLKRTMNFSEIISNTTNTADDGSCGLNESNWHLDTEGFTKYSRPIVLFYECLVFVVSFSWNLFVIIFIFRRKKMLKEPPNIFFVNLAIADFLATLLCVPFYIITVGAESWTFGDNDCVRRGFCKAVAFFLSTLLLVSVYFLAAVAFDRFVAIVYNWQYERLISVKRAWIAVIVCWIVALIVASPPAYGFGAFFFENRLGACLFRWSKNREYVLFFVIQLLIPIIIIIVCTLGTYCRVRKFLNKQHQRTIRHITRQATVRFEVKHKKRQKKVLWIFTTLLVILTLCWAPGMVTAMVGFFVGYEDIPGPVFVVDFMFVLTNIMVNPIVHAFFRKSIRKSIKKFLFAILERVMVCFMMGKGKDFRDNVTSYLRENRDSAQNNSSNSSESNNFASEPTLLTYTAAASTDNIVKDDEISAVVSPAPTIDSATATKYPHSKVKRKVSIIELQQMEEAAEAKSDDEDIEDDEHIGDDEVDFKKESQFIEDGEQQIISRDEGPSGTFMHIL